MDILKKLRDRTVRKNGGWHFFDDGLGHRRVYVNGKELKYAIRANARKGKVIEAVYPLRSDKHGKRLLTRTIRGIVRIEFTEES